MPEIGATLREARMRARIDISEIESQTKIRAKYLRALENEEWDLLPGPTYVKSFLRTYADALGLDGKRLVEEYKLQHERLSDVELQPIAPPGQRGQRPQRSRAGRRWLIGWAVVILLAAIYFVVQNGGSSDDQSGSATTTTTTTAAQATTAHTTTTAKKKKRTTPTRVRLQVIPTGTVYVCLEADGKAVIDKVTMNAGTPSHVFRAKKFEISLGNGQARVKVNGKSFDVPSSSVPLGYRWTPKGRTTLTEAQRPTCAVPAT
jgi:cytoskeleton protein RodZ